MINNNVLKGACHKSQGRIVFSLINLFEDLLSCD